MVSILVHGGNHFIVRGPLQDRDVDVLNRYKMGKAISTSYGKITNSALLSIGRGVSGW